MVGLVIDVVAGMDNLQIADVVLNIFQVFLSSTGSRRSIANACDRAEKCHCVIKNCAKIDCILRSVVNGPLTPERN
jgi:hypothetical protein